MSSESFGFSSLTGNPLDPSTPKDYNAEEQIIQRVVDHLRSIRDGEDLAAAANLVLDGVEIRFVSPDRYEVIE